MGWRTARLGLWAFNMSSDLERWERAGELDALGAILPRDRALQLAGILTDEDVATLRHLAEAGMGDNTLRALASDLGYLEAWCQEATGIALPWPAPLDLLLKFVAHHLWDPAKRASDESHGMPTSVTKTMKERGLLRSTGPHAPSTVRRRLASWATLHRWRNLEGSFNSPALRKAVRLATRAAARPRHRKSRQPVSIEILGTLLERLDREIAGWAPGSGAPARGDVFRALRDRSILSLGFAAGGRRRSEISQLVVEQIEVREVDADGGGSENILIIHLGRTKTQDADEDSSVTVRGRAVSDFATWKEAASLTEGPVYRPIGRWGRMRPHALSPQSVNAILKTRLSEAGFRAADFSAHGLRSGYLTEAFLQGLSLPEAMGQSGHRSTSQAASYFKAVEGGRGRATRLLD